MKSLLRKLLTANTILFLHKMRAIIAALLFGFPARHMTVIGVTGTNGKTTTCNLIAAIFEAAGEKVALATTIQFRIAGQERKNTTKMTTLSPWQLQKFLAEARSKKCSVAVLETTSHALAQHRVWGIPYDTAVLTNLTHDHLDFHGTFEEYRATKRRLFAMAKRAVINNDDEATFPVQNIISYGLDQQSAIMAKRAVYEVDKTTFTAVTPLGQIPIELHLPGQFNVYNALAAISVGVLHNQPLETIKQAIESVKLIRGRMELVNLGQPFKAIVDYAHTPDAFEKIYAALKPTAKGRILHVFGATGDRDKTKRPILGEIAASNADYLFITDEDPYTEDPLKIIDAVAKGVEKVKSTKPKTSGSWWKILDRRAAIRKALSMARPKDVVLVTGKGAEEAMVIGATHVPWSDRQVIEEELGRLGYA